MGNNGGIFDPADTEEQKTTDTNTPFYYRHTEKGYPAALLQEVTFDIVRVPDGQLGSGGCPVYLQHHDRRSPSMGATDFVASLLVLSGEEVDLLVKTGFYHVCIR